MHAETARPKRGNTEVAEELRFFVRIALFALVAGTVYWFVSYEWAGTFLFGFVALGAVFFAVAVGVLIRGARPRPAGGRNALAGVANRTLGFAEHQGDDDEPPLSVGDEPIPPSSIWPLAAALAAVLVGVGLVFGPWFWLPGVVLGTVTAYGWVTELVH